MAARFGHASATKQLLAARINIDLAECNGFTPIFVATQYGHVFVIEQLLVAHSNIDVQSKTGTTARLMYLSVLGHAIDSGSGLSITIDPAV